MAEYLRHFGGAVFTARQVSGRGGDSVNGRVTLLLCTSASSRSRRWNSVVVSVWTRLLTAAAAQPWREALLTLRCLQAARRGSLRSSSELHGTGRAAPALLEPLCALLTRGSPVGTGSATPRRAAAVGSVCAGGTRVLQRAQAKAGPGTRHRKATRRWRLPCHRHLPPLPAAGGSFHGGSPWTTPVSDTCWICRFLTGGSWADQPPCLEYSGRS